MLTSRPLRVGEIFEVTIDEIADCWIGSLQIGVTTHSPATLQFPPMMTDLESGTWILTAYGVKYNGKTTNDDYGQSLDDLTVSISSPTKIDDRTILICKFCQYE